MAGRNHVTFFSYRVSRSEIIAAVRHARSVSVSADECEFSKSFSSTTIYIRSTIIITARGIKKIGTRKLIFFYSSILPSPPPLDHFHISLLYNACRVRVRPRRRRPFLHSCRGPYHNIIVVSAITESCSVPLSILWLSTLFSTDNIIYTMVSCSIFFFFFFIRTTWHLMTVEWNSAECRISRALRFSTSPTTNYLTTTNPQIPTEQSATTERYEKRRSVLYTYTLFAIHHHNIIIRIYYYLIKQTAGDYNIITT